MSPMPPTAQSANQMPPIGPMQSLPQGGPGAGDQPMNGAGGMGPDLTGIMQSMQDSQGALQRLAQALPPLSPFIAQFLTQLGQAVPNVVMSAGGGMAQAPGGPPSLSGPGAGGGMQGAGPGAPPMPPTA